MVVNLPGDPKPLVTSQFPQIVSIQITLHQRPQALHGLAPKCELINMHELINKSTNDYVTLLPCENGANVNN